MANTTWSGTDKTASITLSNLNLTAVATASFQGIRAANGLATGQYYFEVTGTTWSSSSWIGLGTSTAVLNSGTPNNSTYMVASSGTVFVNAVTSGITFGARSAGNVIGIAIDLIGQLIWFRVAPAGNWNANAGFSPGGTGGISISAVGSPLFPMLYYAGLHSFTANFGDTAFSGAVPSGFTAGWPTVAASTTSQARVAILA